MAIFDNANSFDIETGSLAAKRGHSNEVRQFGAMLARDHAMVRQQGRDDRPVAATRAHEPVRFLTKTIGSIGVGSIPCASAR